MKRRAILVLLLALVVSTLAYPEPLRFGRVTIYTRNVYIGTDFGPVLAALQDANGFSDVAQTAFTEIANTNFPLRAKALAAEIEAIQPHLIGLQEVFNFTLNGKNSGVAIQEQLPSCLARDDYECSWGPH